MYKLTLVVSLVLYVYAGAVHAQTNLSQVGPLTMDDAVGIAIANNPSITESNHRLSAAGQSVLAARTLKNPRFTITPSLSGDGSDTELLIEQPLEINGTRAARTKAEGHRYAAANADSITAIRTVVFDTKSAYLELIRSRSELSLAQDLLISTMQFDQLTRDAVRLGSRPAIEQIQSGIEVTRAQQSVTMAQSIAEQDEADLDTQMGQPAGSPVGALEPIPSVYPAVNLTSVLKEALNTRTDITAAAETAAASLDDGQVIRAQGKPDLTPQYRQTRITHGPHDGGFGIALTLPLIDYGSRRHLLQQNNDISKALMSRADTLRAQAEDDVERAVAKVRSADSILQDYPKGLLDQATELLNASRLGYKEGKTDITSLLEAQRTFRSVEVDYINAKVEAARARAELELAAGSYSVNPKWEISK